MDAQHRLYWISRGRAYQVASVIWIGVLAVWLALIPEPAYASQALHLPPAIPGAASGDGWNLYEPPPPDGSDPTELPPDASAEMYLPDLRTLPMSELYIRVLPDGRRSLRLANTIWNSGQGPLELTGEFNAATNRTRVLQHIYTAGDDQREYPVGEFVWHPTHDHWHFDEFTLYEMWTLKPDHSLGKVVVSSDKLSYCVMDTDVVNRDHPRFPLRPGYEGCGRRQQGLSVGWGDTYKSTVDGQALDLTGLPDGFYALTSSVNPNAVILEVDYSNNSALVYLALMGDRMIVVTHKQIRMAECDQILCE